MRTHSWLARSRAAVTSSTPRRGSFRARTRRLALERFEQRMLLSAASPSIDLLASQAPDPASLLIVPAKGGDSKANGEIHGTVWSDRNSNRIHDSGEPPLAGVTVFADLDLDGVLDSGEPSAQSAADGAYALLNVPPGAQTVVENVPAGYTPPVLDYLESAANGSGGLDDIGGASSAACSPDGQYVYVTGGTDDSVSIFRRSISDGTLQHVGTVRNGVDGVTGLVSPTAVAVSPDAVGLNVYVTAKGSNSLAVFRRDVSTGRLTQLDMLQDDVGLDGLAGASSVAVTSDGLYVYVTGAGEDAVSVFQRNPSTGYLGYVNTVLRGIDLVGLGGATSVCVDPLDGSRLYVAGPADNAIAVLQRDTFSGQIFYLYPVQDDSGGVDGLAGVGSLAISPDGTSMYAAGKTDNAVAVFSRDSYGGLAFQQTLRNGTDNVDGLAGAAAVAVDPLGSRVFAVGTQDKAVVEFTRDSLTGQLTFSRCLKNDAAGVQGMSDPEGLAVGSVVSHVYVVSPADSAVAVFGPDSGTGQISYVELQQQGHGGITGLSGAAGVAISGAGQTGGDGALVYVASPTDNSLAVFRRNASNNTLTYVEARKDGSVDGGGHTIDGLAGVRGVTTSPDGVFVYAAGHDDDAVAVFRRNGATGKLDQFVESERDGTGVVDGLAGTWAVAVSPGSGDYLYATGATDNAVAVFRRNVDTGVLNFVQARKDGSGGVDALGGAHGLAVSPDGRNVYVAASADNAISVFSRNDVTGGLDLVESQRDGQLGVDGLGGAESVAVSHDGLYVYVAGRTNNSLAIFRRDTGSGGLSFVRAYFDGADGVDGLAGAASVDASLDGSYVFVAGAQDNAVAVFRRDPSSGNLNFVEVRRNGSQGVQGLAGAAGLAVSPDGTGLYAAAATDSALTAFRVRPFGRQSVVVASGQIVTGVDFANHDVLAPTVDIVDVTPDPRDTAVDQITLQFSEPIGGLEATDLTLTRNGGANLLDGKQQLAASSFGQTWVLSGLGALTTPLGLYEIRLTAAGSGILDESGNLLLTDAADTWAHGQGQISGTAWNDLDGDKIHDSGEPGMANWRVFVDQDNSGSWDGIEPAALTDADGNYSFVEMPPGAYVIAEEPQAGWSQTFPAAGTHAFTLALGENHTGVDFGNHDIVPPTGQLVAVAPDPRTDPVTEVTLQFSEAVAGLEVADLTLVRNDGANLLTDQQTLMSSDGGKTWFLGNLAAVTAASGSYTLTLPAAASGVQDASGNALAADLTDSWIALGTGQISGLVWKDVDGDGAHDADELGMEATRVFIDQNANGAWESPEPQAFADVNGNYTLTQLPGGTHAVTVEVPSTWKITFPTGGIATITLAEGESRTNVNFGSRPPATVTLDVDNSTVVEALNDGLLILRYLFDFRGPALVKGVLGVGAKRTDPAQIVAYLDAARLTMLDVDGNQEVVALNDGLLILRYLFDFRGASLVNGVLGQKATRTDPQEIVTFLGNYRPAAPAKDSASAAKVAAAKSAFISYDAALARTGQWRRHDRVRSLTRLCHDCAGQPSD